MATTHPDYEFGFDASACNSCGGQCCMGDCGSVWITTAEVVALAEHLELSFTATAATYLHKDAHRFVINDTTSHLGAHCTFFDTDKKQCSIYEVRPDQCKTFPFWPEYKEHFSGTILVCPAITFP